MHRFLHGIRRAFLAACGGSPFPCLPALALLREAENDDLLAVPKWPKEVQKGAIQPTPQGSDNSDLKPAQDNHDDAGDLLPQSGEEEDQQVHATLAVADLYLHLQNEEGCYPPMERGAIQGSLPAMQSGEDDEEEEYAAVNNLHKLSKKRGVLSLNTRDEEDNHDAETINERNLHIWYACAIQINMQDVVHYAWQQHPCTFVPAINAWLMPSPRPRVKMKGDLQQHDAHAWKHDAWVSSTSPSNSSIPIPANLFTDGIPSRLLPLLRGSTRCQDRQKQVKMQTRAGMRIKLKTKMFEMGLSYINKDLLDPG